MVLVFGTTERKKDRGYVVDRCPSCLDLRWFALVDHRQAFHLYFVPLGRGRYLYSTQRCMKCDANFPERDDFVTALDLHAMQELDVDEGLRRTQPELAKRFDEIADLAKEGKLAYRATHDANAEDLVARASAQLAALERRGVDTERFLGRFRDFRRLSATEREILCAELRGFHDAVVH
jgi:hypothetical protein